MRIQTVCAIFVLSLGFAVKGVGADLGLPLGSAESEGFSVARLERVRALMHREVDAGHYAGAVWLVARDGVVVTHGAAGWSNIARRIPMDENTVFRIYSMSKIPTIVAALTLLEEGRIALDDPVQKYVPELANRMVVVGGTADAPQLAPADGSITIRQLLTQTSGLLYGIDGEPEPAQTLWRRAGIWGSDSLKAFVAKIAKLPLAHQPGAKWTYGVNDDILGAVIEKVAGQDLELAMHERVFSPLRMSRTSFKPPAAELSRLATVYRVTAAGKLEPDLALGDGSPGSFPSGGGGLYSTVGDCARLGQMLLNGGSLDGVQVLGRKTVEAMTRNQISGVKGHTEAWAPDGFGFGVSVQLQGDAAGALGSPGEYGWDGLATTHLCVDPKEHLVLVLLLQHSPFDQGNIFERFDDTVYQALQ